ncbi:MAG: hypothetical protein M3P49_11290, partial [Actinomycetota bacterium]|nr:hypothetical protein [Actinomycetota bacterium]
MTVFGADGGRHGWGYDAGAWLHQHGPEILQAAQDPTNIGIGAAVLAGAAFAGGYGTKVGVRTLRAARNFLYAAPGEVTLGVRRTRLADYLIDPPVKLPYKDRQKGGVQIVGPTGQGKTSFMKRMIIEDAAQGHTVVCFVADSDLGEDFEEYAEVLGLGDRFFLFDPTVAGAMKFNPLAGDPERVIRQIVDTVASVSANHAFYQDFNEDVVRHVTTLACSYAAYVGKHATIKLLLGLLTNPKVLERLLGVRSTDGQTKVTAPFVAGDLKVWLEQDFLCQSEKVRREYLIGLKNLLRKLLATERCVDALTPKEGERVLDIGDVLDTGGILLFRAPSDALGEVASQTLLTWALQRFQQETFGRKRPRRPVCAYLDEAHVILGHHNGAAARSYARWFVQSRKFGIAPHVGYQSFGQLPDLLKGVLDSSARHKLISGGLLG